MPLYIGKYLAATSHLEALESGAYLHLLMHSWGNGPLPNNPELLRRIAKVPRDAWSNAWELLKPFFTETGAGLVQKGQDEIREEWAKKKVNAKEKATNAAKVRWGKKTIDAPSMPEEVPEEVLEECPLSLSLTTPKEQQQILSRPISAKSDQLAKEINLAIDRLFAYYCESLGRKPTQYTLTPERRKKAELRLKERIKVSGSLEQAEHEAGRCIDNLAESEYHVAGGYIDWTEQIFRSAEEFEKRLTWMKPTNGGASNGAFKSKTESSLDAARQAQAFISARAQEERNRILAEQAWGPETGEAGGGRLLALRTGS